MLAFENLGIDLLNIIDIIPINIYIKDKNGQFIWCNTHQLQNFGLKSINEVVSKTEYDLRYKENADKICKNDKKVIKTGKSIIVQKSGLESGKEKIYWSKKAPLLEKSWDIICTVGVSLDLTEQVNRYNLNNKIKRGMRNLRRYYINNACIYILEGHRYKRRISDLIWGHKKFT
ncbi:MAG: putative sensory histidine-kinase / response regulator [Burkholderiales bacterium]|jgi:transcriptional regulator with PAS, ATPase and Fis domain|nr:putative sensory histidine-kinase / response regulator [Burkholderiales bacterium]